MLPSRPSSRLRWVKLYFLLLPKNERSHGLLIPVEKYIHDVKKASNSGPAMKTRSNDNMKGDKAIVNPVKGAVTS